MRRLHIALLSIFGTGVLLGGIGTGIAIGEYSGLTYRGEVLLGKENLVTEEFCYDFAPEEENVVLSYCHWGDEKKNTLVVEDESVPEDKVCYVVTYNEEMVRPDLNGWKQVRSGDGWKTLEEDDWTEEAAEVVTDQEQDGEITSEAVTDGTDAAEAAGEQEEAGVEALALAGGKKQRRVVLSLENYWIGDEFDVVMRNKDQILQDLKDKKLGSYEIATITDVEIRVNPAAMPYIIDKTR